MDLDKLQQKVGEFNSNNDLDLPPGYRLMDMISETGEVAKEHLKATNYGEKKFKLTNKLKKEVGDLFYALLSLAEETGIDLERECHKTLKKYKERLEQKGEVGSGK